ncbi:type I DNA topoisomerase [Candidatus Mycoplasma mahonii]|uniref:type I DNA topoisomerase n=1 Tax=Candidatus Mycoplasma mahonii TaxID=3004105 RepID=UPI0026EF4AAE|nr:type I DNA topoisomerase [Candidatus Mycoplasma mahonii]WKX02546.1 type I DNA topoisomerase [Candidatus Mycoplasma mahonii]
MSKLVIVESPNKIKSIEKYLGKDYKVMASVGHIVYLPSSGVNQFGVDMDTWTPNYKIDPKKKNVVSKLRQASKKVEEVLIATDPDREGEAIADNLVKFLKIDDKYKRIRFNEITEDAVKEAINNPSVVDDLLVDSQIARRILDRIIGYKLSSLMRKKIYNAPTSPSAGRVQSIAMKLTVLREREIETFVPVQFFLGKAVISEDIEAKYHNRENKEHKEWILPDEAELIKKKLVGPLIVEDIKRSIRSESKKTPFKQAILYKRANSALGMSASAIQMAAQKLYEGYGQGGLITYPRTDSTRMSSSFVTKAKQFISTKFGPKYLAEKISGFAGAQDAHEAIRPTSLDLTPDEAKSSFNLENSEYKVYKLVYINTLQSLMKVPRKEIIRYELEVNEVKFRMSSSKVIFDGYYKASGYDKKRELPKYNIGDAIPVLEYLVEQNETQPPVRFNDGSLIEKLDSIGVGRPSTFATTIRTLKNRDYVTKEGNALKATDFAKIVFDKLITTFPKIMDEEYSSKLERRLDDISGNKTGYKELLDEFWEQFSKALTSAADIIEVTKMMNIPAGKKCSLCEEELIVRRNKRDGTKFFGCSAFPKCMHTEPDPSQKKRFFGKKNYSNKKFVKKETTKKATPKKAIVKKSAPKKKGTGKKVAKKNIIIRDN